jgi:hypothetical protein
MAKRVSDIEWAWQHTHNIWSPFISPSEDAEMVHAFLDEPKLYINNYLKVPEKEKGTLVPFIFKKGQQFIYEVVQMMRKQKRPVRAINEKNRKCGTSSLVAAIMSTIVRFVPGFGMRTTSLSKDSYEEIMGMYFRYYDLLPEEHRPPYFRRLTGKLLELGNKDQATCYQFPGLHSKITAGTAGTTLAVRGPTYRGLHISEGAFFSNMETMMQALLKTVPESPETFFFLESTSNGRQGYFYELFMSARKKLKTSDWDWYPIFLPSWIDEDCNPEITSEQDAFIQSNLDDYEFGMKKRFGVSNNYIWWRRNELSATFKGNKIRFDLESAPSLDEAFAASGQSMFPPQAIEFYLKNTVMAGRRGKLIVPDHPAGTKPRPYFEPDEDGILTLWHFPKVGEKYVAGADSAMGLRGASAQDDDAEYEGSTNPDYCSCIIFDSKRVQVAELHVRLITSEAFSYEVSAVCRFFNNALLNPEAGPGSGLGMIYYLRDHYSNIFRWEYLDTATKKKKSQLGWEANQKTKSIMIGGAVQAVLHGSGLSDTTVNPEEAKKPKLVIRSKDLLLEMGGFAEWKSGSFGSRGNGKDDRVIAMSLALLAWPDIAKKTPGQQRALPPGITAHPQVWYPHTGKPKKQKPSNWTQM